MKWATHDDIVNARDKRGLKVRSTFEGRSLKASPSDVERHRAALAALGLEDDEGRIVPVVIGTNKRARDGHVIHLEGMDVEHYTANNPVVLWNHDRYELPIGRAPIVDVDTDAGVLRSLCQFASRDVNPHGHLVGEMVARGYLRAPSIGWDTIEAEPTSDEEVLRVFPWAMEILRSELLEYSVVTVEADTYSGFGRALHLAKGDGLDIAPAIAQIEKYLDSARTFSDSLERIRAEHKEKTTMQVNGTRMSEKEFLDEKVPMLIEEGKTGSEAVAIALDMFAEMNKGPDGENAEGDNLDDDEGVAPRADDEEMPPPEEERAARSIRNVIADMRELLAEAEEMMQGEDEEARKYDDLVARALKL